MEGLGDVRRELVKAYRELGNWRAVGRAFGISGGMAFRVAVQGYEPKEPRIRVRLGLSARVEVSACPHCGGVHLKRGCDVRRPRHRDLWAMESEELLFALENRVEVGG
jgi:hypothetical protein